MASAIAPHRPFSPSFFNDAMSFLYVLHYCQVCGSAFFAVYGPPKTTLYSYDVNGVYTLLTVAPKSPMNLYIDPIIEKMSPSFVQIYLEANVAENEGLVSICGMAYRKALEFLVKDYLIEKFPDESARISSEPLAQSIKRIDSRQIQTLAERTAWLGNDEAHYVRKHANYSYKDIKIFLEAIVAFILCEKRVDQAAAIPHI